MSTGLTEIESSVRHGYVEAGSVRLHYVQRGSGERLVILLHGFPECWYSWRHQLMSLGDRYTVVAVDLRGYNLSGKPPRVEDYRVSLLTDDVLSIVRHFGAREAAIVGHDWGAFVAWAFAYKHPEYVWKLAALQVPPPAAWIANMTFRQAMRSWYMLFYQLPHVPEWSISANNFAALERIFKSTARPGTFTNTDITIYKAALRKPGALTGAINYYRANTGWMKKAVASLMQQRRSGGSGTVDERVRVPTLFIYGEQDFAILPETVRGVRAYVDAPYREVRIATSGHWVQQEAPTEVNSALKDFLDAA